MTPYDRILDFANCIGWQNVAVDVRQGVQFLVFDTGAVALGTILTMTEKQ